MKKFLVNLYGVYAAVATTACLLIVGVIVLVAPGLQRRRRIARRGLRLTFFCAGMPFKVTGLDRLPDEPSVAIANHSSYLDGLVVIAALPPSFTPVIKVEVSYVPIIRTVLRRVGARYVQRAPAMKAGRDAKRLLDALRAGESLAVFPEGTFSVDEGLLPFRGGAFFLAAKTASPVVPVAIQGSRKVLPAGRMLPCPAAVKVEILEALRSQETGRDAAKRLRDRTETALWHGLWPRTREHPRNAPDYAYYCDVLKDQSLPQAYLDLDLLEDNIRSVLERSGSKQLRVDAHSLRCPGVIDRVLRSNMRFHGVKCATGFEAVYLAREWALKDILVAYPTMQRGAIEHVCAAVADGCEITMSADSPQHLARLEEAAHAAGIILPVCVEVDMSTAKRSRRSPLRASDDVLSLLAVLAKHEHLHFRGVLAFDTQRSNVLDWYTSSRGRRLMARRMDAGAKRQLHARRRELSEQLAGKGFPPELFNGGGEGGIEFNAADSVISEITVGAALFAPELDDNDFQGVPAAAFVAEVIRHPADGVYACLGGGYNAADTLSPDGLPRPFLPSGVELDCPYGVGESHIPIRYPGGLRLGDPLFLRPPNAGELCERFRELLLVQGGAVVDSALTYRAVGTRLS